MKFSYASVRSRYLVSVLALVFVTGAFAQQKSDRNYQFEDETVETLDAYRKAGEEPVKDYVKIQALLDTRLAKIKNKSGYDYAMLLQFKGKTYLEQNDFARAIEPMSTGLALSDAATPTYLDERSSNEVSLFLAQIYFQESSTFKDQERIRTYLDNAERYISRWAKNSPKPTEDGLSFYAGLLYNRAILDEKNVDKAKINQSMALIDQCLHLTTRPKDNLYLLKLVCLQQLDRNAESAEIFELLVKNKPENKTYWKQLASTYIGLEKPVRAILTLERAQANGLLNTPPENYNIVGLYFNEGQYEHAAELLESGLKTGAIENEVKNWQLLSYCYQQLNRDFKAINALEQATKFFPKDSQIEYLIAQNYNTLQKPVEALAHLTACIKKGGGNKPHQTYLFMAFIAYEQKQYDVALDAANKAIALPEGKKEGARMRRAVQDAIKDREEKLKKM